MQYTANSTILRRASLNALLLLVACCVLGNAWAEKPEWAGHGNGKKGRPSEREDSGRVEIRIGSYFEDRQRVAVSEYYGTQARSGHCPPGLAKKHNGCLPPGQAKKWHMGQALASDIVFYPVPSEVVVRIGLPPSGYKYVRVANDILLLAIGSRMVVDAIEDLIKP